MPTSGEPRNLVVLGDIPVKANVLEVLADEVCGGVALASAFSRRFQVIELLHNLRETLLQELFTGNPCVEFMVKS